MKKQINAEGKFKPIPSIYVKNTNSSANLKEIKIIHPFEFIQSKNKITKVSEIISNFDR